MQEEMGEQGRHVRLSVRACAAQNFAVRMDRAAAKMETMHTNNKQQTRVKHQQANIQTNMRSGVYLCRVTQNRQLTPRNRKLWQEDTYV